MPSFYEKLLEYRRDVLLPAMTEYLFYRGQFSHTEAEKEFPLGEAAHYWAGLILGISPIESNLSRSETPERFQQAKDLITGVIKTTQANRKKRPQTTAIDEEANRICESAVQELEALTMEVYRAEKKASELRK